MLTIPFWALASAAGWDWMVSRLAALARSRTLIRPAALTVATALLFVLAIDTASDARARHQGFETSGRNIRAAAVATGDTLGESCVLIARFAPQAGYYSECLIAPFQEPMVIPAALTAAAPELADTPGESALDQSILTTAWLLEPMRLGCEVRTTDDGSVAGCKWSAPTSPRAASVRLFRLDPDVDPHRMVVYRSEDLSQTTFTDNKVRADHRYVYAVQAYDANGQVVGRSRAEWVRIPPIDDPTVEVLKLACALGDSRAWVGCEWSRPVSADAAVVSLWRSVDGGARELVEQFRPEGPTVYRDVVPSGAGSITYAVATTESDRLMARSRPVTVRIPRTDTRPVGTVAPVRDTTTTVDSSARPVVTRPAEVVAP